MRLTGAALLVLAGLLAGIGAAADLGAAVRRREGLRLMLERMAFELERFKTPLPELFDLLGGQLEGEAGALCRYAAQALAGPAKPAMADIWARAVSALPPAEREVLMPLGHVLGRYGADEQRRALESARTAMEQAEAQARQTLRRSGRMYVGVPAAAAAMLAVLLL